MKYKPVVLAAFLSLVSLSHQGSPPPPPSSSSSSWSFDSFPDAFWDPSQGSSVVGLPTYSPELHHHSQQTSTFLSSPPFHPEREGEQQQQQPTARPSRRRNKAPLIRDTIEFPPNSAPLIDLIRARPTNVHRAHTQKSFATSFSQNDQVKAIDLENLNPNQIAYAFSLLYPTDVDSVTKQRLTYAIREYLERSDLVDEEKKDSVLYHLSGLTKKSKLKLREENSVQERQREEQGHQPLAAHHHRNEDVSSYSYLLAGRPVHQDQGQDNSGARDKEHEAEEGGEEDEDANPFVAFFRQVGLPSTASEAIQVAQSFYPQSGYGQRQTTYRLMLFLYSHYPQGEVDRARRSYDQAVRATARNRRRIEKEERVHSLSKSKERRTHGSGSSSGGGSGSNSSRRGTAHATAMEVDGGVENRYGGYGYAAEQQRAASGYQHPFTEFPHWLQESGDHTSGGSGEEVVYPHSNTFGQQERLYNSDLSDPNYRPHEHLPVHPSHQAHFLSPHSTEPVPEDYTFWYNMYQQTKDNPNQPPPI